MEKNEEVKDNSNNHLQNDKIDHENIENVIDFRWSDVEGEDEENIAETNLIKNLQKQADEKI